MNQHNFIIKLTNGIITNDYPTTAFNSNEAIILAQAEAIKQGKGYKLVDVYLIN